jgi:hypothetical protein
MTDDDEQLTAEETQNYIKIGIIATVAVLILTGITVYAYRYAKKRSSTVVLPGGTTYLGPGQDQQTPAPPVVPQSFTIDSTTAWKEYSGKVYPYSFSYPETLTLVVFPSDKTDSVAISFNNIPAQQNLMLRVSDIADLEPDLKEYIAKPKKEYVNNWWKQYSGLKGVKNIEEFVNTRGMKGYKALYLTQSNETPNMDVFFEVPGKPGIMVWLSRSVLDQSVFDRIIDTFFWDKSKPIKAVAN